MNEELGCVFRSRAERLNISLEMGWIVDGGMQKRTDILILCHFDRQVRE